MKIKKIVFAIMLVIMVVPVFAATRTSTTDLSGTTALSISLVNQDPDPAIAGDIVEVRIGVENTGGKSANNIIIEIVPEYPVQLVPGEDAKQKIGTIQGYQEDENMKIVKFKIRIDKDSTAGGYELKVKHYEEGSTASIQTSLSIDVESKESAEVIYIDKTSLIPGEENSLTFTINNVGGAPLRDLTFNWENEDKIILPVGSDNRKYIKYIDIGEDTDLEYRVIADTNADPGLYKLDLTLTYEDPITGEDKEINTIAGIYVGGGTDFDVAFSESSSGQTSFTIANVGSNPAFSVSVIIPQQQGWRVSGSNSMIVGNLNTGDYTVASFSLQSMQAGTTTKQDQGLSREEMMAQRGTQTQNTLKIQIAYTDTMGKRELVEKEVAMNTQSLMSSTTTDSETTVSSAQMPTFRRMRQQSFFSKYKWYIVVLVILVVIGLAYRKYKKEKLLDPNFKFKDAFKIKTLFKKKSKAR